MADEGVDVEQTTPKKKVYDKAFPGRVCGACVLD
jgi:hypothetical protein